MIEGVTEEMHGSDRVFDLKTITSEPWVGMAKSSTRAKWRALRSARASAPQKCLTPPTLLETRYYVNSAENSCQPRGGRSGRCDLPFTLTGKSSHIRGSGSQRRAFPAFHTRVSK